jgi:hypothetical protein
MDLILGFIPHTQAVLPDLASLALDHEFTSIGFVVPWKAYEERGKRKEIVGEYRCCHRHNG